MNKVEIKKFFWNLVKNIEDCSDTITKSDTGVIEEVGMTICDDYTVMFGLDDGVIRIYNKEHFPLAAFTEESETLLILKELFECLEITAPEVPVQEQSQININKLRVENGLEAIPNGEHNFISTKLSDN